MEKNLFLVEEGVLKLYLNFLEVLLVSMKLLWLGLVDLI
jgi:hypothetical protein